MKPNIIDRAVSFVSPERGLRRAAAKEALNSYYDGAKRTGQLQDYRPPQSDPNTPIKLEGEELVKAARDLVRNNPYAQKAVSAIQNMVVGTGIKPSVQDPKLNEALQEWATSPLTDFDERMDLYGLQSLIMRTIVESGECLIERVVDTSLPTGKIPLRLNIMEPDYFVKDATVADDNVSMGIKYQNGHRHSYLLYKYHPSSQDAYANGYEYREVPAKNCIHAYRLDRAKQARGVSWFAPVTEPLKIYQQYEKAQLARQYTAAAFSAVITSPSHASLRPRQGPHHLHDTQIQPNTFVELYPGESIEVISPPGVEGYKDLAELTLHQIAAGFGISYMSLTGDFSAVNFSSSRMAHIQEDRNIQAWRDHIMFTQVLHRIGEWFLRAAALEGYNTKGQKVTWDAPVREMTNPKEEIEAAVALISNGLSDLPTQQRKFGRNPEDIIAKTIASNKALDEAGMQVACDPRKFTIPGAQQIQQPTEDDLQELKNKLQSYNKLVTEQAEIFRNQGKSMYVSQERYE